MVREWWACGRLLDILWLWRCYTSITSQLCRWNETFCRKVRSYRKKCTCTHNVKWMPCLSVTHHMIALFQIEPSLVLNTQFQRSKRGRDVGEPPSRPGKVLKCKPHSTALKMFQRELQQLSLSSAMFSSLAPLTKTIPPTSVVRKLPSPLTVLQK